VSQVLVMTPPRLGDGVFRPVFISLPSASVRMLDLRPGVCSDPLLVTHTLMAYYHEDTHTKAIEGTNM
jgi:hypothetical protein